MNTLKFLTYSLLTLFIVSCGGTSTTATNLFELQFDGDKSRFKRYETININLKNKKNKEITKVIYSISGKTLEVTDNKITLNITKVGNKTLNAEVFYDGTSATVSKKIKVFAENAPKIYSYEIINQFPHDKTSFTQGLEFYNDTLYEGTGKRGQSVLRSLNYNTGEVYKEKKLVSTQFGEGITLLNDKIFQLTWQSNIGIVYDRQKFTEIDQFTYGKSKEGWGLCNDGEKLYKSDGTEKIWTLNSKTLVEESAIEIYTNSVKLIKINELEYVAGKIYANTWQSNKDVAVIIDPKSGVVEGIINFNGLKDKLSNKEEADVLNGIAYHPTRKSFFVTGKYWDKLFEVKIVEK